MARSQFPRARPSWEPARKRPPKQWRTHVLTSDGVVDGDGTVICSTCSFRADHKIHDLYSDIAVDASELDARKLGEGSDG